MAKVNYENMKVTHSNLPSKRALRNYYSMLIDNLIAEYGLNNVKIVFDELMRKHEDEIQLKD